VLDHFPGWNRQTTVQPEVSDRARRNKDTGSETERGGKMEWVGARSPRDAATRPTSNERDLAEVSVRPAPGSDDGSPRDTTTRPTSNERDLAEVSVRTASGGTCGDRRRGSIQLESDP
jgi:hypothetical protein